MKLYWSPQTRSPRAIWMLEESGIEYEMELVDIRRRPGYVAAMEKASG